MKTIKFKNWIYCYFTNPLQQYNLVKKYFKPLTRQVQFGPVYSKNYSKFIDFRVYDVTWKDKYDSPRHEYDPCISLVLFNKWKVFIDWKFIDFNGEDHSCEYWEAALSFLYYKKDLYTAVKENTGWYSYNVDGEKVYNEYKLLNDHYQDLYERDELLNVTYEKI